MKTRNGSLRKSCSVANPAGLDRSVLSARHVPHLKLGICFGCRKHGAPCMRVEVESDWLLRYVERLPTLAARFSIRARTLCRLLLRVRQMRQKPRRPN